MHGFGNVGNLDFLVGEEVIQICFGCHQIQINCHPAASIHVESRVAHHIPSLNLVQEWAEKDSSVGTRLTRLLACRITSAKIAADSTLQITFDNGDELLIHDDSKMYESCQISGGPQGLIVV